MNKCIKGESCLHCNTDYCRFKDEVAELKAENERLKEKYNVASFECNNLRELKTKYRQVLQEIREIANIIYNTNCNYVAESHKIIDKINEVLGGNNEN